MTDLDGDVDPTLVDGLARLIESTVRHTTALARARDLTPTDLRALGLVQRGGSMRPGELARALQISASGTTGVMRRLVAAGLLCRDGGPANHRAAPVSQVAAACEELDLSPTEREAIAAFVLRLIEPVEVDADAMRAAATRARVRVPAPPRWS
jgi:DNA-binding MarR family transcriptional regulator